MSCDCDKTIFAQSDMIWILEKDIPAMAKMLESLLNDIPIKLFNGVMEYEDAREQSINAIRVTQKALTQSLEEVKENCLSLLEHTQNMKNCCK